MWASWYHPQLVPTFKLPLIKYHDFIWETYNSLLWLNDVERQRGNEKKCSFLSQKKISKKSLFFCPSIYRLTHKLNYNLCEKEFMDRQFGFLASHLNIQIIHQKSTKGVGNSNHFCRLLQLLQTLILSTLD